jgi:SlyX protein
VELRLEAAEIHITHLSRTVEDLSDQVARQSDQIDRLNKRLEALIERLMQPPNEGYHSDVPLLEQRPPHW